MGGDLGWPPAGWLKFKLWSSQQSWGCSQDCTGKGKDESLNYFSCNSIPGIILHGKSTLEALSYLNYQKIWAKLMIPSNTSEWSSFWFNYLTFWTRNTFYRVWRKKVDSKCGPSHLWPVTNFLSPNIQENTLIYTHIHILFSHFYMDKQALYILFYILICFTLPMSWNSFCISTRRRASLFFTAVQYPIVWLRQNLLNWFPGVGVG